MSVEGQGQIGPYRLLNMVNRGQSSQVWSAIDDRKQQRLALKILLADFRRDKEHIAYLRNEHLVGHLLDHPNAIHIYDFAIERGIPYVTMELFLAPNMKDLLLRSRETMAYLFPKIIRESAAGLAHLHSHGYIHRDIKPDNFLVDAEGAVRLIDYALAQKRKSALARLLGGKPKIQGTRSYISPEQIRGDALDARSDVYSYGCTLFHLLAGAPPYTGANSNDLLSKHLKSPPPSIEAYNKNITPDFGKLLRTMMAKDPQARPDSMDGFLREFGALQLYKRQPPRPDEAAARQNPA